MSYKCQICGSNTVDNQGDVCELCAIGQDPYAASMSNAASSISSQKPHVLIDSIDESKDRDYSSKRGSSRKMLLNGGSTLFNCDPYGNDMTVSDTVTQVQVYSAGQIPQITYNSINSASAPISMGNSNKEPITSGITKNIVIDTQKKSILVKWFRSLFKEIPFTLDDDVTLFQVFPDYSGTALNAMGNACDQVIVYGKLNNGAVSENNDIEVYGRRDSNNNIIAKTIKNKASGTTIKPMKSLGVLGVWIITLILLCLIAAFIYVFGVEGIIWTVVILLCLTNLPTVIKVLGATIGFIFSLFKRMF